MRPVLLRGAAYMARSFRRVTYWRTEREYWRERLQTWYQHTYELCPHPFQNDESKTPSGRLVARIQPRGRSKPIGFITSGQRIVLHYLQELHDYGYDPRRFNRILDFGVGFGRLLVHYYPFSAELHGCDITGAAIKFVQSKYHERINLVHHSEYPSLPYGDRAFDFIYANSVFTHIQTNHLKAWIKELARISRPGACVIISVFDASLYLPHLAEHEFDAIESGSGYLEFGSAHVRQRLLYATPARHKDWWGEHFHVLEQRRHFKEQDHLIMRRVD